MNIVNWNMQGANHSTENKWNTGVYNLLNGTADVCCLQECGGIPASARLVQANYGGYVGLDLYTTGTERTLKYILFFQSDPNGNRVNLAIVSNIAPTGGALLFPANPPIWRPVIGLLINGLGVFSIHAISPNGPDAPGLVQAVAGFMGGGDATVSGDYNREPDTMLGNGVVCPPNQNTYSSTNPTRKLDYMIKSGGNVTEGLVLDLFLSDHLPVLYTV